MRGGLTYLLFALFATISGVAQESKHGQGSVSVEDIEPVLTQERKSWDEILSKFDVYHVADARMITYDDCPRLNGVRIGPYQLWARRRGDDGPYNFSIWVRTDVKFIDDLGREVTMDRASDLVEKVKSIEVVMLKPGDYFVP